MVRLLRSGASVLLPYRLTTVELRKRYGWTPSAAGLYRRKGVLPPPDGRDGARDWWWETTIDAWERDRDLQWCEECRHAFVSLIGLREHRTRMHG